MSFHVTAQDIRVDDKHVLVAQLQNESGEYVDASIDLSPFLGNKNGQFQWFGTNFSENAEDVHFAIEGDGEVPVLRAQLNNGNGELVGADVNLAEHIQNVNGVFQFQ